MKNKILMGLGAISAIALPIAVISCSCSSKSKKEIIAEPKPVDPGVKTTPPVVDPAPDKTTGSGVAPVDPEVKVTPPVVTPPVVTPPVVTPPVVTPPVVTPPVVTPPEAKKDFLIFKGNRAVFDERTNREEYDSVVIADSYLHDDFDQAMSHTIANKYENEGPRLRKWIESYFRNDGAQSVIRIGYYIFVKGLITFRGQKVLAELPEGVNTIADIYRYYQEKIDNDKDNGTGIYASTDSYITFNRNQW